MAHSWCSCCSARRFAMVWQVVTAVVVKSFPGSHREPPLHGPRFARGHIAATLARARAGAAREYGNLSVCCQNASHAAICRSMSEAPKWCSRKQVVGQRACTLSKEHYRDQSDFLLHTCKFVHDPNLHTCTPGHLNFLQTCTRCKLHLCTPAYVLTCTRSTFLGFYVCEECVR